MLLVVVVEVVVVVVVIVIVEIVVEAEVVLLLLTSPPESLAPSFWHHLSQSIQAAYGQSAKVGALRQVGAQHQEVHRHCCETCPQEMDERCEEVYGGSLLRDVLCNRLSTNRTLSVL